MTDLWSMMGGCDSVSTVDALLASGCSLDELFDDLQSSSSSGQTPALRT